jgi:hypothetical protein
MSSNQIFYKSGASLARIQHEQAECRQLLGTFNPLVYVPLAVVSVDAYTNRETLHLSPKNEAACMRMKGYELVTAEESYARERADIINRHYAPLQEAP